MEITPAQENFQADAFDVRNAFNDRPNSRFNIDISILFLTKKQKGRQGRLLLPKLQNLTSIGDCGAECRCKRFWK
jgi:hypothetical protein